MDSTPDPFDPILRLIVVIVSIWGIVAFFFACHHIKKIREAVEAMARKMGALATPPSPAPPPPRVQLTYFGNPKTSKTPKPDPFTTLKL